MKSGMTALIIAGGMLALIFVAGFFHDDRPQCAKPACPAPGKPVPSCTNDAYERQQYTSAACCDESPGKERPTAPALPLLGDRTYKLQCECALKVRAVLEMQERLEALLAEHRGTIEQLEINGTERGREGFAVVSVPTDRFDPFVKAVRALGTMERERLTATAWKPGSAAGGEAVPETAAVSLHFSDIASSAAVDESKGVLAASFGRSASHFLKGFAVLVEAVGYALPFIAAAMLFFGPAFVIVKVTRRLRASHAA